MTARKPLCITCQAASTTLFCRVCAKAYDRASERQDGTLHDAYRWIAERTRKMVKPKRPPLPRAVRELLRDVVKLDYDEESPFTKMVDGWVVPSLDAMAKRAARILGTTPAAIVARARKVSK